MIRPTLIVRRRRGEASARQPRRRLRTALIAALVVLGAARLALPFVVERKLNAKLGSLEGGWEGRVEDVRLAIWRGAVSLRGFTMSQESTGTLLKIPALGVDLSWANLFRGLVVADVAMARPSMRVTLERTKAAAEIAKEEVKEEIAEKKAEEGKKGATLGELLSSLTPFRIDSFVIEDGSLRVRESSSQAEAEIDKIDFRVSNLTNRPSKSDEGASARAKASARVMETGSFGLSLRMNPTAKQPTFSTAFEVKDVQLARLNPVLRGEFGVDVEKGRFELVGEAKAADGAFSGYVKPFIEDLELLGGGDKGKSPLKKVKEAVIGAVAGLLKSEDEAVAARVPFEGRFDNPEVGVWEAVFSVLRNAFITALKPSFEGKTKQGKGARRASRQKAAER